ncbi:nuclear transcription factor Y subunit B [Panicum miliaceum]|uniref:Nuclear transcription factor Y subunit B n=1 Tax=Panicum miliaceum TaxID=4540 RepID=A0A3L6SZ23_PANMI|nr:nuclear transcription factor Y subunit B [Panicum miliaceum]
MRDRLLLAKNLEEGMTEEKKNTAGVKVVGGEIEKPKRNKKATHASIATSIEELGKHGLEEELNQIKHEEGAAEAKNDATWRAMKNNCETLSRTNHLKHMPKRVSVGWPARGGGGPAAVREERMADAPASPGGGGGSHESGSPRGGGGGGGGGGDSKLTAKAGDGSIKKDALGHGGASSSATQGMGQQGVYNQAMGYMQPQSSTHHLSGFAIRLEARISAFHHSTAMVLSQFDLRPGLVVRR